MQPNFRDIVETALILIVIALFIHQILLKVDQITPADIDISLQHAQLYLISVYNESYLYEDSYIHCSPPCDPRYKKIDGAINLIWIREEVKEHSLIDYQIKNADEFLKNQTTLLENEPLFNGEGVFIGDQHCILASMYNDTRIIREIGATAKPYGWANRSVFDDENLFKKISYESWCVMLLAEKGNNKSTAVEMTENAMNEAMGVIQNPAVSPRSKTYAALHTLILFKKLDELGYQTENYKNNMRILQDYLADAADDSSLIGDTNVQSLVLDILSDYNYPHSETKKIALRLLERQDEDGGWVMFINKKSNDGKAFTTLHAILALNRYRLAYLGG